MLSTSGAAKAKGLSIPLAQCLGKDAPRLAWRNQSCPSRRASLLVDSRLPSKRNPTITPTSATQRFHTFSRLKAPEIENTGRSDAEPVEVSRQNLQAAYKKTGDGGVEAAAKWARETFRDNAIPDGILSAEEMKVYVRLYGEPEVELLDENHEAAMLGQEDNPVLVEQKADHGSWELVAEEVEAAEVEEVEEVLEEPEALELVLQEMTEDVMEDTPAKTVVSAEGDDVIPEDSVWGTDESYTKIHPHTLATRFGPFPSTVFLPKSTFTEPVAQMLVGASKDNLRTAAELAFGGVGLPYSPSTPRISRSMEQRPIPLSSRQSRMKDQDADVFMSAVMPQTYASAMSIFSEVRKRLGSEWLHGLFDGESEPFILDAGSAGAGVLAFREILKAEFGEETEKAGKATVVVGSDTLRRRASRLLDNTTFIPRLPDRVPVEQPTNHPLRKQYDVIIASHQMWPIKTEVERKYMVEQLWSLLNPNGGVLIVLEKGIPRGFEALAGARHHILSRLMKHPEGAITPNNPAVPDAEDIEALEAQEENSKKIKKRSKSEQADAKNMPIDSGMIIAPCTNHATCPMYQTSGLSRGRKDWCHFSQRFIRPPFLQSILGASQRNHEDVEFSYLAVRRGVDFREPSPNTKTSTAHSMVEQNQAATERAAHGYGNEKRMTRDSYTRIRLEKELQRLKQAQAARLAKVAEDGELPVEEALSDEDSMLSEDLLEMTEGLEAALKDQTAWIDGVDDEASPSGGWNDTTSPFMLPRTILPPLKRKGHILFDMCTPAGTIERWFVSKKSGKATYRDARHARWGDLWPLGAYSRTPKNPRSGKPVAKVNAKYLTGRKAVAAAARQDLEYNLDGEEDDVK
jgi:ribosomal protein RSM22 (predicted rRNA methylase)